MKTSVRVSLLVGLLLCLASFCAAQSSPNCDGLSNKIEPLERMLNEVSPSMQQVYREALLKLYLQAKQCIERDLAVATKMRTIVAGTAAAPGVEEKFQL